MNFELAEEHRMLKDKGLQRLQAMPDIVRGFFAHPECGFVK
jgi:hypothetical protein